MPSRAGLLGLAALGMILSRLSCQPAKQANSPNMSDTTRSAVAGDTVEGVGGGGHEDTAPLLASDTTKESGGGGGGHVAPPPLQDRLDPVFKIIDSVKIGGMAFSVPESMRVGELRTIQMLVNPSASIEEVSRQITVAGKKEGALVKLTPRMAAVLTGAAFGIRSITPDTQAIVAATTTEWRWQVQALTPGRQSLSLTLNALLTVEGSTVPHTFKSFERSILVHVSMGQQVGGFIGRNWQWLWTTIAVPLVGGLWANKRRRKRRANRNSSSSVSKPPTR